MGRIPKNTKLSNKEERQKLKPRPGSPYWHQLHPGLSIGYRKGARGGVWLARRFKDGCYTKGRLGKADDHEEANGKDVLNFSEACSRVFRFEPEEPHRKPPGTYTVGDALEDYLQWFEAHRKSAYATKRALGLHVSRKLRQRPVSELTSREIRQWHEGIAGSRARARSKSVPRYRPDNGADPEENTRRRRATSNRILTILKAALSHAFREGHVDNDLAWRRVKPYREVDAPHIRYLDDTEIGRLLNACPADFRQIVHGAVLTGARYGELRGMRCTDYNSDAGSVFVRLSKAGKSRHVPLSDEGIELMERLSSGQLGDAYLFKREDGESWGAGQQVRRIAEACKIASIKPAIRFNDLRHSYASILVMRGVTLEVIAESLGHSDTRMTKKHYAHLRPSYVSETIRQHLPRFTKATARPKVRRLK